MSINLIFLRNSERHVLSLFLNINATTTRVLQAKLERNGPETVIKVTSRRGEHGIIFFESRECLLGSLLIIRTCPTTSRNPCTRDHVRGAINGAT